MFDSDFPMEVLALYCEKEQEWWIDVDQNDLCLAEGCRCMCCKCDCRPIPVTVDKR